MSSENILDKVKKLSELTGVGFKDCKNAIDYCKGDLDKSVDFLVKIGIFRPIFTYSLVISLILSIIYDPLYKSFYRE